MPDFGPVVAQWTRLRARHPTLEPALVIDMIRATIAAVSGDLNLRKTEIQGEIDVLSRAIAVARNEILDLGVDEIMALQIPAASSELDAIVAHTAAAADTILDSCEMVDGVAERLDSDEGRRLQNATTRIYEACSFQDITGQRISKVMVALKAIDAGLTRIGLGLTGAAVSQPAVLSFDGHLTNGPQLPGLAADQDEIDRLLASFD